MATSWLRWTFAAAMVGVALFHVLRLAASRERHRRHRVDAELTHAAMGAVMTVMLLGVISPVQGRRLALLFAGALLWFAWRGVASYVRHGWPAVGPPTRHVVGCAAMVYMLKAVSGTSGAAAVPTMSMATTSWASPVLVAMLLLATLAVALWTMTRPLAVGLPATPALAACQLAMNAATVYMLIAM